MHSFLLIPKQQIAMPPSHGRNISKLRANHLPPRSEGAREGAVQLDCSLKREPAVGRSDTCRADAPKMEKPTQVF